MKKLLTILLSLLFVAGLTGNAGAWQIELGDAYDVSGYWAYDIGFSGDVTDNLNNINLSLGYDTEDVTFTTVLYHEYDDGAFPVAADTWIGNMVPYNDTRVSGLIYDIQGQEPLGASGLFYPEATGQTLLFTLYFLEVPDGSFDDTSVYFTYGSDLTEFAVEAVNINGTINNNHDLLITNDTINIAPVPVPAAILLMGSGIIGLFGIRFRKKDYF